ncbi:hypothetical protein CGRA01v4_11448 [Colletotrichum graminicola]|nr:hypothetical protein CGRA01v4_11448 [Colletotrichum graminicola]
MSLSNIKNGTSEMDLRAERSPKKKRKRARHLEMPVIVLRAFISYRTGASAETERPSTAGKLD